MTAGRLVSSRFPYVPIRVDVRGRQIETEALLDTGFQGHVIVPTSLVASVSSPDGGAQWTLADGSTVRAPYFHGSVALGMLGPFPVVVTALGDEPLIGQAIIRHLTITLDHGTQVIVEP